MSYDTTTLNTYVCEVCDREESLTEQDAYMAGWDYPPFIGVWGIVSPRTCPNCPMIATAYWSLMTDPSEPLNERQIGTIKRILAEPIAVNS